MMRLVAKVVEVSWTNCDVYADDGGEYDDGVMMAFVLKALNANLQEKVE